MGVWAYGRMGVWAKGYWGTAEGSCESAALVSIYMYHGVSLLGLTITILGL